MTVAIIVYTVVSALLIIISLIFDFKNKKVENNIIRLPIFYRYFGIIMYLLFLLPIYATLLSSERSNGAEYIFIVAEIFIPFMVLSQINWKLCYEADGLTYQSIFRIRKKYSYDEVKYIKHIKIGDIIIRIKNKALPIIIDPYANGYEDFIKVYNTYKFKTQNQH